MLLAAVHVGEPGGAEHPVGPRGRDGATDSVVIGDVQMRQIPGRVMAVGTGGVVPPLGKRAEQRRAHLAGGADHERTHQVMVSMKCGRYRSRPPRATRPTACPPSGGRSTLGSLWD